MKKQEAVLAECRQNIDPLDMDELEALEGRIVFVKEVLSRGRLEVSDIGFSGAFSTKRYMPLPGLIPGVKVTESWQSVT